MSNATPYVILLAGRFGAQQLPLRQEMESSFPEARFKEAATEADVASAVNAQRPHLILCDLAATGMTVEALVGVLKAQDVRVRIVAVAEPGTSPDVPHIMTQGARDVISRKDPLHALLVIARELEILPEWCTRNAHQLESRASKQAMAHAVGDELTWCNDAFLQLFGRHAPAELAGKNFWSAVDGDDHYRVKRALQSTAAGRAPASPVEANVLTADGARVPVNLRLALRTVDGNAVVSMTARKSAAGSVPAAYAGKLNVAVLKRLQSAVATNGLALAVQPISPLVESGPADVNKTDVLVRIRDADGELAAAEFMREASAAGLLKQLDHWVIKHACALYARNAGSGAETLYFLRISRQTLQDRSTITLLRSAMAQYQVKPAHISFEIAEAEFAGLQAEEAGTLFALKKEGCRLTLSQYGARESSIETMQVLPLDFVKLDVKLTGEAAKSEEARVQLRKVIGLATKRNIGTISTRVADAMTLAELWKLGINYVQGHYVHEPEIVVEAHQRGR